MKMECSVVPTFFFLAMALVCSYAGMYMEWTIPNVHLADPPVIIVGDSVKITCGASLIKQMESEQYVVELGLGRKTGSSSEERIIATFSYRNSDKGGQLAIAAEYNDDRWLISGHGEGQVGNLTAVITKAECSDGGDYICYVTSKYPGSETIFKYKAVGTVPSKASFDKIEVKGFTDSGKDIFQNAVRPGERVTLTCTTEGPIALFLTWRKNGKDIGNDNEFEDVLKIGPRVQPELIGHCEKYRQKVSMVIKAKSRQSYQCQWSYFERTASINVTINTNDLSTRSDEILHGFHTAL